MSKAGPKKKRGRPRTKAATTLEPDLTVGQAAQQLAVSRRTLLRLIDAGELAAYDAQTDPAKGHRMLRVTRAALGEFKAARTILTPGEDGS